MSAFIFRTTFKATGDQQKDAITQIEVMQEQAVKGFEAQPYEIVR
ncbi:hypothetical protein ABI152_24365 (plasmid) [Escherichia coli]